MQLDPNRLARQQKAFDIWRSPPFNAKGGITAATGFGKTFIIIMAIKWMNERHPDRNAIVIVPNLNLNDDWVGYWNHNADKSKTWVQGHIEKHKLENVRVFVLNTFVSMKDWKCDLLAIDEVHRTLNEDTKNFSQALAIVQYKYLLVLTATLEKAQEEYLLRFNIPIVDRIPLGECIANGWVAPSSTFNLKVNLKQVDIDYYNEINDKFKYYFAKFGHNFNIVQACNISDNAYLSARDSKGNYIGKKSGKDWRLYIAQVNNWDGTDSHPYSPKNIAKNAAQCMHWTRIRKDTLQNYPSKLDTAEEVINFLKGEKTIVFTETAKFADELKKRLGNKAVIYHTNLETRGIKGSQEIIVNDQAHKKLLIAQGYTILGKAKLKAHAIKQFSDSNSGVDAMITVRALDEGADLPRVDNTLTTAYSSKERQSTQRDGRGGRIEYNNLTKKTKQIYLYIPNTQEEKWLKLAQKAKTSPRYIESVEELNEDSTIKLSTGGQKQISSTQIRIIGNNP